MQVPEQFVTNMERLFTDCRQVLRRRQANGDEEQEGEGLCDSIIIQLESSILLVEEGIQMLQASPQYSTETQVLFSMRRNAIQYMREILYGHDDCTVPPVAIQPFKTYIHTGNAGRPQILVNLEQVELLRGCGYTWVEVADCLNVSRSTIWRHLKEMDVSLETFSDISDSDLDDIVGRFHHGSQNIGQAMIQGLLLQQGIHVQRYRVRESIARTDPIGRSLRWHQAVQRRSYSVQGANSLWHIDGHHSLVRWRFVIHGGIDGYSRLIVYLNCNTNNRADTVMREFRKATEEFGVPSRVRSDRGGENVEVCYFMVTYRDPDRASYIAGSSVHNQRIERLWRDVYRCVCSTYHEVFYEMERQEILDPDCETDLFVLHCIFLPRIRKQLRSWIFEGMESTSYENRT